MITQYYTLKFSWQSHEDVKEFLEVWRTQTRDRIPTRDSAEAIGVASWVSTGCDLVNVNGIASSEEAQGRLTSLKASGCW